jgi:hypothetical protein
VNKRFPYIKPVKKKAQLPTQTVRSCQCQYVSDTVVTHLMADLHWCTRSTLPNRADETPREPVRSQWASQDTKSRFWATYLQEAAEHDGQILDKYKSDMDIVLIFVSILPWHHLFSYSFA